jgi:hypothetical protein
VEEKGARWCAARAHRDTPPRPWASRGGS